MVIPEASRLPHWMTGAGMELEVDAIWWLNLNQVALLTTNHKSYSKSLDIILSQNPMLRAPDG